ncbi:MAG: NHL repeat-containing protein [bacterium]|nr:hypothetical protein [Planctomycetota bacterium]HIL51175.1 hypothetical protein [Planctomycetota bacterium]
MRIADIFVVLILGGGLGVSRNNSAMAERALTAREQAVEEDQRPPLTRPLAQHENIAEPSGVMLLADGRLLVSQLFEGSILVIAEDGSREVLVEGLDGPRDLCAEAPSQEGAAVLHLWVVESFGRRVRRIGLDGSLGISLGAELLVRPMGLACTAGRVFVADAGSHCVQVFGTGGEHLLRMGEHGSGLGQLIAPGDVAVSAAGRIFVSDHGNSRIEVFDRDGEPEVYEEDSWGWRFGGGWGPYPGLFMGPAGLEIRGEEVFVVDERNHRVQVFDLFGEPKGQFGLHAIRPREGAGKLHYPRALGLSPDGERAALTEPLLDRVQIFAREGGAEEDLLRKRVTQLARPSAHFGTRISISGPLLAIGEPESHSVLIHENTWKEPRRITRVAGLGTKTGLLSSVAGVDLAHADRSLLVVDSVLRRLSSYRLRGGDSEEVLFDPLMARFVKSYDFKSAWHEELAGADLGAVPEPIAVDRGPLGRIYLLDRRNRGVLVLEPDFSARSEWCSQGVLGEPRDLAVDPSGERYAVSDAGAGCVLVFRAGAPPGKAQRFGADLDLIEPHGVVFDSRGRLFVSDAGRHEVLCFAADGELLRRWGRSGLGRGEFLEPRGLAIDHEGRVVVMDHGNHRGQVFTAEGEYLSVFGSRLYTKPARFPAHPEMDDGE